MKYYLVSYFVACVYLFWEKKLKINYKNATNILQPTLSPLYL